LVCCDLTKVNHGAGGEVRLWVSDEGVFEG
jgi:hypothetical protein